MLCHSAVKSRMVCTATAKENGMLCYSAVKSRMVCGEVCSVMTSRMVCSVAVRKQARSNSPHSHYCSTSSVPHSMRNLHRCRDLRCCARLAIGLQMKTPGG